MRELRPPLSEADIRQLKAGDEVLVSGTIYTARDMAHKRLCEALARGEALPINLEGAILYFVGPTPARAGAVIGAAGPTTSSRVAAEVIAYEDLGTEAIRRLEVVDFPAVVAYDAAGGDVYAMNKAVSGG